MTSTHKAIRNVRLFAMGVAEASRAVAVGRGSPQLPLPTPKQCRGSVAEASRCVAVSPNYLMTSLARGSLEGFRGRRGGVAEASRKRRGASRWGLLAPLGPILPPTHTPSATTAHWNQKHLKPTSLHCFVTCLELLWLAATRNEAFTKPGPAWPFKSFQNACESS